MSVIEPKAIASDSYKTITTSGESLFKDRGSKFLGFVYHVSDEDEINEILAELKKKYYDARHWCYAYILNPTDPVYRINDDGEPAHSAGTPIYHQLLSAEVYDVLAVVVRYFGGTKLGVPGLIHAYGTAAADAITTCSVQEMHITLKAKINFPYPLMNDAMRVIKDLDLSIIKEDMGLRGGYHLEFRKGLKNEVEQRFNLLHELNFEYF